MERGYQSKLLPDSDVGPVPPGTRTIWATLTAVRVNGAYNDGYADDLSIVLPEPSAAALALAAVATLALSTRRIADLRQDLPRKDIWPVVRQCLKPPLASPLSLSLRNPRHVSSPYPG